MLIMPPTFCPSRGQRTLRALRDRDRGVENKVTFLPPPVEPVLAWAEAKDESSRRIACVCASAERSRPPNPWRPPLPLLSFSGAA